jgi:hypothetical protein
MDRSNTSKQSSSSNSSNSSSSSKHSGSGSQGLTSNNSSSQGTTTGTGASNSANSHSSSSYASSTTSYASSTTQSQAKKEYKIISLQDFSRNSPLIEILNSNQLITLETEALSFLKQAKSKNKDKQLLIIEIDKLNRKERAILPTGI